MEKSLQISDSEIEIMRIIWNNGGTAMFAQIMNVLNEKDREWKPNTVLTFLARLADKGIISSIKHGRNNEYIALITAQDYLAEQTKTFVHKVYGGNAKHLVSSLLKQDFINSDDMDELKRFWGEGVDIDE